MLYVNDIMVQKHKTDVLICSEVNNDLQINLTIC